MARGENWIQRQHNMIAGDSKLLLIHSSICSIRVCWHMADMTIRPLGVLGHSYIASLQDSERMPVIVCYCMRLKCLKASCITDCVIVLCPAWCNQIISYTCKTRDIKTFFYFLDFPLAVKANCNMARRLCFSFESMCQRTVQLSYLVLSSLCLLSCIMFSTGKCPASAKCGPCVKKQWSTHCLSLQEAISYKAAALHFTMSEWTVQKTEWLVLPVFFFFIESEWNPSTHSSKHSWEA